MIKSIKTETLSGASVPTPIPPHFDDHDIEQSVYDLLRRKYEFNYSWEDNYKNTYFATDVISLINFINREITVNLPSIVILPDPNAPEPEPESEPLSSMRVSEVDIGSNSYYKLEAKYDSSDDSKKLTGFLATFDINSNIEVDLSESGINATNNAFIYGTVTLDINGTETEFQKAYVGPKSIALAVPLSAGLDGDGTFMLLGYINKPTSGEELKLKHGWSDTGPYCSIDVNSEMVDESSVAKFLQYPGRSLKNVLTINMDPKTGKISLHTLNQKILESYRLKAIQLEFESLPSSEFKYMWLSFEVPTLSGGVYNARWHNEISGPNSFDSVTYISCTLDVADLKDNLPDGVQINNANYNITEIYNDDRLHLSDPTNGYLNTNGFPKLSENQGSSTQVLLWDIDNGRDITCRNAPFDGEFKLSICNKEIADFYDSESE